ncbi:MAG: ABC transporter permease subunit [Candidatus Latescibacteria bacterium]|nr:ABC transporter permease subunit [Candidatus Latescibacterota bacterium]NIM21004.1 ABC transporter permease subunit [Candidatus Latescibacterota bacterium]NIM65139.1 ABC transporter permease subunit [Candidatus Latescibacterota bacterium]NIO01654.1 ABC transporter permease subunit [Candidatus Latescibacterota bacterium]NIO28171.1 ABC transporter permease subunit [Candidatus Latescibacterota bacterium]
MPALILAKYTIKLYIRERVLLIVLLFGFILMISSYVLAPIAVGAQQKIVVDVGLASISILGILLIILFGASSFYREREKGILSSLLSKPISRVDFILGKYAGTAVTVIAVMMLMAILHLFVMLLSGVDLNAQIFWAVYLSLIEASVITSVMAFFSSFTTPVLGSFFTLCVLVSGTLSKDLLAFAEQFGEGAFKVMTKFFYYLLPNLSLFNARQEAVHNLPLQEGYIYSVTIYGIFYTLFMLFLSALIFRRRDVR